MLYRNTAPEFIPDLTVNDITVYFGITTDYESNAIDEASGVRPVTNFGIESDGRLWISNSVDEITDIYYYNGKYFLGNTTQMYYDSWKTTDYHRVLLTNIITTCDNTAKINRSYLLNKRHAIISYPDTTYKRSNSFIFKRWDKTGPTATDEPIEMSVHQTVNDDLHYGNYITIGLGQNGYKENGSRLCEVPKLGCFPQFYHKIFSADSGSNALGSHAIDIEFWKDPTPVNGQYKLRIRYKIQSASQWTEVTPAWQSEFKDNTVPSEFLIVLQGPGGKGNEWAPGGCGACWVGIIRFVDPQDKYKIHIGKWGDTSDYTTIKWVNSQDENLLVKLTCGGTGWGSSAGEGERGYGDPGNCYITTQYEPDIFKTIFSGANQNRFNVSRPYIYCTNYTADQSYNINRIRNGAASASSWETYLSYFWLGSGYDNYGGYGHKGTDESLWTGLGKGFLDIFY